ncbi:amino acid adenylation domain-containing protein [Pendulispora brunnea]|uniref:Amino acid adenylation domain-containing protein n=1 Tax=Pendulispora brunnea TaxID=2905690 RepID=A0ABZ2KC97_9BACT
MAASDAESLYQLFQACVRRYPQRIAVRFGAQALTYSELHERAEFHAARLLDLGVTPGMPVAMLTERSLEMIVGIWAILRIGAAYVPIDPEYPQERIQSILRDSGALVHLTVPFLAQDAPPGRAVLPPAGPAAGPAYIIYTSGSTGAPKGVAVTHHNVIRTVARPNYIDIDAKDCLLQLLNYAFDGSVFNIFGALLNGATLVLAQRDDVADPERLAAVIRDSGISVLVLTTALFNVCIDYDPSIFDSVRKVLFGGEQASVPHVKRAFEHLGPGKLVHVYGPTETTVICSAHTIERVGETVPIGKAVANTRLYVLDANREPSPIGEPGELYIAGEGVSQGYWRDAELTRQRFVPDPFVARGEANTLPLMYKSGDLVKWQEDGELVFIGRVDQQVKVRGFRIELGEIETRLMEHPQVKQCVVVLKAQKLIAFVTTAEVVDGDALKAHLRTTLPYYMIPERFVHLPRLPLTANGKVDRQKLASDAGEGAHPGPRVPARTAREETLHRIFAEVLGVPEVGADEGFSDIGGNSLNAITLAARLKRAGFSVTTRDILHCQTIERLLAEVLPLPAREPAASQDTGTGLRPLEQLDVEAVRRLLDPSLAHNDQILTSTVVAKEYPLCAMQQLQIGFETPACFAMHPLKGAVELPALQRAYAALIAQHGLLRSAAVESGERHVWREYEHRAEELPSIPVIDLAEYAGSTSAVQARVEQVATRVYKGAQILHQLVLVRRNGNEHFLAWIVSHVILDKVTQEILTRHLMRHYEDALQGRPPRTEASPSFEDYTRQLARGPQGIGMQHIVQSFRLRKFYEAKQTAKRLVTATASHSATNFNIVLPLRSAWQVENTLEVALTVHAKGLQRYLQMDSLPLLFVTEGRQYEGRRYYDTVGEFTDAVPLLVDARFSSQEITGSVVERMDLLKKHNLNFLHLLLDPAARALWPEVARLMDAGEGFEDFDILMFNFLGNVDDTPVEETCRVEPHPLPIQTLLNGITTVCSDTLVCSFRTSCAVDVARIRACFEHAASELP